MSFPQLVFAGWDFWRGPDFNRTFNGHDTSAFTAVIENPAELSTTYWKNNESALGPTMVGLDDLGIIRT
jgi:hypothetical protein